MIKFLLFTFFVTVFGCVESFSQKNNPPVVKIIDPTNKNRYGLNSQIQYQIKVTDTEDGESAYGEIAANEVFLEVRYVAEASTISTPAISTPDPNGLTAIKKSNCFTCHAFNAKLIAPSFYEITKRYPATTANGILLAKRIREGSGGIWGTASMPSHTEISHQQALEIVNWILKNGQDPNLNYYVGTEGSFKLLVPERIGHDGALILSATYSDHGAKNSNQSLTSKDVVVVNLK